MTKKQDSKPESKAMSETPENNVKGRRKLLKKVSTVGAVATVAAWTKPSLYSVVTPAHAQTSVAAVVLAGNIGSTPVVNNSSPKANSVLDFFVGSAHAQESGPSLAGACLTIRVDGASITMVFDFTSAPSITIDGVLSGSSLSGSGSGITVSATLNLAAEVATALGTVSNSSGTFNVSIDSSTSECAPMEPEEPEEPPIVLVATSSANASGPVGSVIPVAAFLGELNAGLNNGDVGDRLDISTGDSTHCVTVTVNGDRQSVNVAVNGPDIPYGFVRVSDSSDSQQEPSSYYYYNYEASESLNFSGSSANAVPLNSAREFDVTINGLRVEGALDESLMTASGRMVIVSGATSPVAIGTTEYSGNIIVAQGGSGYGAYFYAQVGNQCSPGMGLRRQVRLRQ